MRTVPRTGASSSGSDGATVERVREVARRESVALTGRVRERPWLFAGIAAGCGFLLGGGLATPLAARMLRRGAGVALQMAVAPILLSQLEQALGRFVGADAGTARGRREVEVGKPES